jgi:hypothetical protein
LWGRLEMSPCPGSLPTRSADHGSLGAGDRLRPWLNTFGPARRVRVMRRRLHSRRARHTHNTVTRSKRALPGSRHLCAVSAYPPRAPYSRGGRGGACITSSPGVIGCGATEGRGHYSKFCVLCVGADKTSMSGDVIPVQVDLITGSRDSFPTGR